MSYAYIRQSARTTDADPPSSADVLRQTGVAVGAFLARLRLRLPDSRERLTSTEERLAASGVSWSLDLAYETELAREVAAARQQRVGGAMAGSRGSRPVVVSRAANDIVMKNPVLAWSATMGD